MQAEEITKQLNDGVTHEIIQKMEVVLKTLADKVGAGVDHFWPLFVRQQAINSITILVILMVFAMVSVGLIHYAKKFWKKADFTEYHWNMNAILCFWPGLVGILLAVGVLIGTACTMSTVVTGFANPEYQAVVSVVDMFKSSSK